MIEIRFPLVDDDAPDAEGVVSTWFVEDGARVTTGMLVAEVQVTKISDEIEAPADGTLRHTVKEGTVAKRGDLVAVIE